MKRLIGCLLFGLLCQTTFATTDAQGELLKLLNGYKTLQARFHQKIINAKGQVSGKSHGKMSIKRPNHFRWEVQGPYHQLMIANGKTLWIYDKDLEQVIIRPLATKRKLSPASLLSGDMEDYSKLFQVKRLKHNQYQAFKLIPKQEKTMVQSIALYFKNGKLKEMRLIDEFEQKSHYVFSRVKINPKLNDKHFKFKVPKGVDVIDNRQGQSS